MIPTQLRFLCLAIAAFAPLFMSLRPGWWMAYYYAALLVWWVVLSLVAVRRERANRAADRPLLEILRRYWDIQNAQNAATARPPVAAVWPTRATRRLIIVGRDQIDLYGRVRSRSLRRQLEDTGITVITDRRGTDRRRALRGHSPERRRGERRRYNVQPLLLMQGWAEIRRSEN
jgi:hypothetical protein